MRETDTSERIVLAAVEIINTHGTRAVTTRKIAETAGVNPAAVNYHFGSRENLLREALDLTLSHLFEDWEMILSRDSLTLPGKVYFLLEYMLEGIFRYPGLTRSYIVDPEVSDYTRNMFSNRLARVIGSIASGDDVKEAIARALYCVLAAGILPGMYQELTGGSLAAEGSRRAFLISLIQGIPGFCLEFTPELIQELQSLRALAFREEGRG